MSVDQRLQSLEQKMDILSGFATIDPEIANTLITFWFVVFISGYCAGMICRWLGKR